MATGRELTNGRPGMELWKIVVLGTVLLNGNWAYDKFKDIADNHKTIRPTMGISPYADTKRFNLQTLKYNVKLLTSEVLNEINQLVVQSGHELVKKKRKKSKRAAIRLW